MNKKALVVLSGGQDSTTTLFWAKTRFQEVHAITFNYNQRHHVEIQAAKEVAFLAGVASHSIVPVGPILKGRSPLTNPRASLEQYSSYDEMESVIGDRVELTFVPMRNAFFLTLAANWALSNDIYTLITGVCQQDNANYPDCRNVFIQAQETCIRYALGLDKEGRFADFEIKTPLMYLSKAESIALARSIPGAYETLAFTHTAYDGQYPPTGRDHATLLRQQGFLEAGVPDPLVIRAVSEGKMELPQTPNYGDRDFIACLVDVINSMKVRFNHAETNTEQY